MALRWRARIALDAIYRHIAPEYEFKKVSKGTTRGVARNGFGLFPDQIPQPHRISPKTS